MRRHVSLGLALLVGLALPAAAGAQNPGQGATPGTSRNFDRVGHSPLSSRGMNAALALYHNYAYIGNRADVSTQPVHPGILVLDTANAARPRIVGEIPPPPTGQTTRELRVWPQANLLIVMRFRCVPLTHACPLTPDVWSIDFYDLTGANARQPQFLASYVPSVKPHEMYLWLDPERRGRALLYISTPSNVERDVGRANLIVTDISRAREGVFTEIARFTANPFYTPAQRDELGPASHSMWVSADGRRTHLSYLTGGYFVLDSSDVADAEASPELRLLTPVMNSPRWPNQTVHSSIPLPGRPYVLTTDELYGERLNPDPPNVHGCPWGWAHVIDVRDPANPRLVAEYRTEGNTADFCSTPFGRDDYGSSHTAHNPTAYSDLVFVSWHASGLQAISLANPARPAQAGWFTPRPLPAVAREDVSLSSTGNRVAMWSFPIVKNGRIYVVDIRNGLYVLRYTGAGPSAARVDRTIFLEGNSNLSESCPVATATPRRVTAGRVARVTVTVRLFGQPVDRARVRLVGDGLSRVATTGQSGTVALTVRPRRAGTINVTVPNVARYCVTPITVRPAPRPAAGAAPALTGRVR